MGTQFGVDLVFKTKGQSGIQSFERTTKQLDQSAKRAQGSLDRAGKKATEFGTKAKRASGGVNSLARSVRGLVTAAALLGTAKFVIGKTAELETQTRSLKVLTGELEIAKRIVGELQSFAAVTPFTSSELIESAKRLKAFGVDTEKLVATTQRLADVSGATGARLNEVATAYGQIQAKGRLQGEELLQLQERGIALQDELQKMYGLTGEEFSKALQKGQFSAEAAEVAIKRLTEAGGKYADGAISQSDTLAGKFSTLIDGIENIARTLGNVLSPALKAILTEAIGVINAINSAINIGQKAMRFGLDQSQQKSILDQARSEAEEIVNLRNIKDPFERNKVFQQVAAERESDLLDAYGYKSGKLQVEIEPVITENKIPDLLNNNTKTQSGSSGGRSKRTKALKDDSAEIARQLQDSQDLLDVLNAQMKIQQATNGFAKIDAEFALDELQLTQKYRDELANIKSLEEQNNLIKAKGLELDILRDKKRQDQFSLAQEEFKAFMSNEKELNTELTQTQELLKGAYDIVAQELTGAIQGLIKGTTEWGDVLSSILSQLGSMFLQAGFNGLGSALKIPGYAEGGRPAVSRPAIVGERGPELFVPDSAGTVISNDDIFAATRSALSGGGVGAADNSEGNADAFAAAAAAMNTTRESRESTKMMKYAESEKVALANPAPINIKYDSRVINSETFVTEAQFQQGLKQSANQARAMTISDLRNKPASRKRAGVG